MEHKDIERINELALQRTDVLECSILLPDGLPVRKRS